MAKTKILVAARQLQGGTKKPDKDNPSFVLAAKEELTSAAQKKLGLSKEDVAALVARGDVVEVDARAAESGGNDSAAVKAAEKRASDAEAKVTELEAKVTELETEIATLKAPQA